MKKTTKLLAALLAVVMVVAMGACGKTPAAPATSGSASASGSATTPAGDKAAAPTGTIVVSSDDINGQFTPLFGNSVPDLNVYNKVIEFALDNDRAGAPCDSICKFAEPVTTDKNGDGTPDETTYTLTLKDEVIFSDGTKPTADDMIFAVKVLCDPTYDGKMTFYAIPVQGLNEYRYDDPDAATKLAEIDKKIKAYVPSEADIAAVVKELVAAYGVPDKDLAKGGVYYESDTLPTAIENYSKGLKDKYISETLAVTGGNKVPEISGVKKIDDKTITVTIDGIDPKAIWEVAGIPIIPQKYYGEGFKKGKLDGVKAKSGTPMGTGPYKFVSFENNVVSLEANLTYWRGTPKTAKLKYQVTDESAKLESVKLGNVDVADPAAALETITAAKDAGIEVLLIDNLGYGYVGMSAARLDKNVRKGLMSLLNRGPSVEAAFGDMASVIERPMSKVSWAYPTDCKPYYNYSKDDAKKYFAAAGYKDEGGKLVKNGKQLKVEAFVGDLNTHPSKPMFTQLKADMAELGAELVLQDVGFDVLVTNVEAGTADMWCMAWQATIDPDMYQVYNSESTDNPYHLNNKELDKLMMDARSTLDINKRKELYSKCLDMIMDEAVEMPFYQRKNMVIVNPEIVDITTLPKDMTPFYTWDKEIWNLATVAK
ncbi:MAG: ABC transporter substrate-binding protein [Angelakisella sp.]